jgi:hypothetical protein
MRAHNRYEGRLADAPV